VPLLTGGADSVWRPPALWYFLAGGASPLIAATLLTALEGGAPAIVRLYRRLTQCRSIGLRWWLVILGFWPAFDLVLAGLAMLLGVTSSPMNPTAAPLTDPGAVVLLLLLCVVFPAAEEVGLRGYWLDRLRQHVPPLTAALLNGAAWALWHAPFVAFPGYYDQTAFAPALSWWMPLIVGHAVLIAWIYWATGRSLCAAVAFHAMMNLTGECLGLSPAVFPLAPWLTLALVAIVARDWQTRPPHVDDGPGA
jgi:membrane protease YdiL (CAAX protease family)